MENSEVSRVLEVGVRVFHFQDFGFLEDEYSTVVEKYKTGEGKNKSNKRSKPSGSSVGGDKGSRNSDADGDGDQGSGGGEYRKRIRLQKSRRIITERSA